jgi:hypothetical protein
MSTTRQTGRIGVEFGERTDPPGAPDVDDDRR